MTIEGGISELLKQFIGFVLIFLIIGLSILGVELNQVNSFKQEVNFTIERNGGLTPTAMQEIKENNDTYYSGRYKVEATNDAQKDVKVKIHEIVPYKITASYEMLFFDVLSFDISYGGKATSKVR